MALICSHSDPQAFIIMFKAHKHQDTTYFYSNCLKYEVPQHRATHETQTEISANQSATWPSQRPRCLNILDTLCIYLCKTKSKSILGTGTYISVDMQVIMIETTSYTEIMHLLPQKI